MTRPKTVKLACPTCGATFCSLDWADPLRALQAHWRFGPLKCVRPA